MVTASRKAFLEGYIVHTNYARIGLKTTVCCLTLYNGFEIVGTSAPADIRLFDKALGLRYAYEDAIAQMDKFFAFLQQDRHHMQEEAFQKLQAAMEDVE